MVHIFNHLDPSGESLLTSEGQTPETSEEGLATDPISTERITDSGREHVCTLYAHTRVIHAYVVNHVMETEALLNQVLKPHPLCVCQHMSCEEIS